MDDTPVPAAARAAGFAHYELLSELGRGGAGIVYKARQIAADRVVALKALRGAGLADDDRLHRFRAEARALGRLRHPNIVQIFEVGDEDGWPFFSMEYVEGGTLAARIRRSGALPPAEAAAVAELLAGALDAAHRAGVLHRDLKPSNILLTDEGVPKVTDFGLAKRLDAPDGPTPSGVALGTPSYMAPEQATRPELVGPRTDVYGVGATLYEMLTGRPPHRAETPIATLYLVTSAEVVPPGRLRPVPAELETICLKCLQKSPDDRYPTAAAVADDLRRWRTGETGGGIHRSARRARVVRTGLMLVLAAALSLSRGKTGETPGRPAEPTAAGDAVARGARGPVAIPLSAGRWVAGPARIEQTRDGAFKFQTMRNSLLELAAPGSGRFRITAEFRHHSARAGGCVGLYLGHTPHRIVKGTWHQMVLIWFCEAGSLSSNLLKGETDFLTEDAVRGGAFQRRGLTGELTLPALGKRAEVWRAITADVGPDEVRVRWREEDGASTEALVWSAKEIDRSTNGHKQLAALGIGPRSWVPNRPVGIFARDSLVSVRNVIFEEFPGTP